MTPKSPRPKRPPAVDVRQSSLFGPLDHIESALAREISMLDKYARDKYAPLLHEARENVRTVNEGLLSLREKRSKRTRK